MSLPLKRPATYEDVLAAPENMVAELIHGVLHTQPRPRLGHGSIAFDLGVELGPPFKRGRGGPGGWIFAFEPELHLGENVVVPDIAGWRVERAPRDPDVVGVTVAPNWVCEILSPTTRRLDRGAKADIYAGAGVAWMWLIESDDKLLEVYKLENAQWLRLMAFEGDALAAAPPFDAIEIDLGQLWPPAKKDDV